MPLCPAPLFHYKWSRVLDFTWNPPTAPPFAPFECRPQARQVPSATAYSNAVAACGRRAGPTALRLFEEMTLRLGSRVGGPRSRVVEEPGRCFSCFSFQQRGENRVKRGTSKFKDVETLAPIASKALWRLDWKGQLKQCSNMHSQHGWLIGGRIFGMSLAMHVRGSNSADSAMGLRSYHLMLWGPW